MRLSGKQIAALAEISDGEELIVVHTKKHGTVDVSRPKDGFRVLVDLHGQQTVLKQPAEMEP